MTKPHRHLIGGKSWYAQKWLIGGTAFQVALALTGSWATFGSPGSTEWANPDVAAAISVVALLLAAWRMHVADYNRETEMGSGFGVRYVYAKMRAKHRVDDNVISGVLSRESIQGAITLGILGALTANAEVPASLWDMLSRPKVLFPTVIILTLALSVITTLAGILSYDYSSRFEWGENQAPRELIQHQLMNRGHKLGQWGFYSLMWSLAALGILRSYYLCMIAVLVVFWVMWYYYFFSVYVAAQCLPDLQNVNLNERVLDNIKLQDGVDLSHAKLQSASLKNASLKGANLTGADLTGAHIEGADLGNATVTQAQIDSAFGDQNTKLPNGLTPPTTWPTG